MLEGILRRTSLDELPNLTNVSPAPCHRWGRDRMPIHHNQAFRSGQEAISCATVFIPGSRVGRR